MKLKYPFLSALFLASFCGSLVAAPLLTEGFESYARGALDANLSGGPNNNTNNPWAGPFLFPDNCHVTGAELSPNSIPVTPHGGTNMVRGSLRGSDFDQDFYNLGYWLNAANGNAPFYGNFSVDWWFFDSVGLGTNSATPDQYCDYLAIAYYGSFPTNASYAPDLGDSGAGLPSTRISIGGTGNQTVVFDGTNAQSGYNSSQYQTRDENQPGYDGNGWFNLPTTVRSVGWHHARIEVLPQRADTSVDVALYLDNLLVPCFRLNPATPSGFNCIELNANYGPTPITAYYDDISFSLLPSPSLSAAKVGTNAVITWSHSWILQSSTNLAADVWTDVVDAQTNFVNSPYTNRINAGPQYYFRLRN